ncbi:OmpA family protein [Vibrio gallicus]|uniref:OmpA family protein n=1 Tax=Vibrio gallicus TaxID=190897 RepID=UPI0021C269CF|nr:OmpA family protein [Vibrio gallicus]
MKKVLIISLTSLLLFGCANDTETYMETPLPEQQADLRDFDNDGVINARDKCPGTPRGAEVSNDGCEEYYEVTQQQTLKILFQNNSTEVNPVFGSQIEGMAEFLKEYPETSVELKGFASTPGSNTYNIELSRNRAIVVQDKIISFGVDPNRIAIVGFGEEESTSDDPTTEALDRRVEATVVGFKGDFIKQWTIFTKLPK